MQYFPLEPLFFFALVGALIALFFLIEIGVLRLAYSRLGLSPGAARLTLIATLIGSAINIPLFQFREEKILGGRIVHYFGMRYVVPKVVDWPGTVVAVNVGGALIPTVLSLYLLERHHLWGRGLIATAIVAAVCHHYAEPVEGIGIALPIFVPPLVAALTALIVSWRYAAPLAYIAGSLGTLIGADLLNLDKVQGLGAPVASIGGAGTFDGIFVAGIVAVLIAGLFGGDAPAPGAQYAR